MRDERRPPFCYQTLDVTRAIRQRFAGKQRTTALALYQTLTEEAQVRWRDGGRDGFMASRAQLAEAAGVSEPTLDKYARAFVEMGLLRIERSRQAGGMHLPNVWAVTDMGVAKPVNPGVKPVTQGVAKPVNRGGQTNRTLTSSEELLEANGAERARADADAPEELSLAERLLEEFAKRSGRSWASKGNIGLVQMRIDEYPDLTYEEHVKILDAAFANPWWEEAVPPPAVVYGPKVWDRRVAELGGRRRIKQFEHQRGADYYRDALRERDAA